MVPPTRTLAWMLSLRAVMAILACLMSLHGRAGEVRTVRTQAGALALHAASRGTRELAKVTEESAKVTEESAMAPSLAGLVRSVRVVWSAVWRCKLPGSSFQSGEAEGCRARGVEGLPYLYDVKPSPALRNK